MIKKLFLLSVPLFLLACASGPTPQEMEAASSNFVMITPPTDKAVVYIYYMHGDDSKEFGDVAYTLDENEKFVGKLFYGQHFSFIAEPGGHTISWRGNGKPNEGAYSDSLKVNLEAGKTYILSQVHGTMFNRYSADGLSVISSLNISKKPLYAKYNLSRTQKSEPTERCLEKKEISLTPEVCL